MMKFKTQIKSAVGVGALCYALVGCSLPKDLSGYTFKNVSASTEYAFEKSHATFQMEAPHALFETEIPAEGPVAVLAPNENMANMSVMYVVSRNNGSKDARLFLYPFDASFRCDVSGQVTSPEGNYAKELYESCVASEPTDEVILELCDEAISREWFSALFVSVDGETSTGNLAIENIISALKNNTGGQFYLLLSDSPNVAYSTGDSVEIADIPVKYDENTVTLQWTSASYRYPITGKMQVLLSEWLELDDKIIFRIEDDENFLFNPETSSRWKRY